jgi:hypothetical protein
MKDVDEVVEAFIASPTKRNVNSPLLQPKPNRSTRRSGNEHPDERPEVDEPVFVGGRTKGRPAVRKRGEIPSAWTTRAKR